MKSVNCEYPKRILVLGNIAVGKSTFAKVLGRAWELPVYHLDAYFWQPGWKMPNKAFWTEWIEKTILTDRWVLDGNYVTSLPARAAKADLLVFIDLPSHVSLFRYIYRSLKRTRQTAGDIPENNDERVKWRNIKAILFFRRDVRPKILALESSAHRFIVFRSTQVAIEWVASQNAP